MAFENKYIITKDKNTKEITYIRFESKKGFGVKPRNNVLSNQMVKVDEMVIINPSLIEKLVDKKCKRTLEKIIHLLTFMYEDEDGDSGSCELILDEITRFKNLLETKYQEYMDFEDYKLTLKKLEIIKAEVELRKRKIYDQFLMNYEENLNSKKGGR